MTHAAAMASATGILNHSNHRAANVLLLRSAAFLKRCHECKNYVLSYAVGKLVHSWRSDTFNTQFLLWGYGLPRCVKQRIRLRIVLADRLSFLSILLFWFISVFVFLTLCVEIKIIIISGEKPIIFRCDWHITWHRSTNHKAQHIRLRFTRRVALPRVFCARSNGRLVYPDFNHRVKITTGNVTTWFTTARKDRP